MEVVLELELSQEEAEQLGLKNEKRISLTTLKEPLQKKE